MNSKLFVDAVRGTNQSGKLPIWMMRQAGRYHHHYQKLRSKYSFRDLCLVPELSCETTLGPIQDFGFDAAILFSDILFAIEACGVHVAYEVDGPKLAFHVKRQSDQSQLKSPRSDFFDFQKQACQLLRERLPKTCGLIGFVGAPWTLFVFLVEGTHKGSLDTARKLYFDGTFSSVAPLLEDAVISSLQAQRDGGADVLQIFDTAAGHLTALEYSGPAFESHLRVLKRARTFCDDLIFFAKGVTSEYRCIRELPWTTLSVDWNWDLREALDWVGPSRSLQGNVHPEILFQSPQSVRDIVTNHFRHFHKCPRLIANLGHGILPKTPEASVRAFVDAMRSY